MKSLLFGIILISLNNIWAEDNSKESLSLDAPDSRLEVRKSFPTYRVYYNVEEVAQEVRESLESEQKETEPLSKDEN